MTNILYGLPVREKIKEKILNKLSNIQIKPKMVILQIGDREDSNIYIEQKIKFGEEVGIDVLLKKYDEDIQEEKIIYDILNLNNDQSVSGIVVQLPLPNFLNKDRILNSISIKKDVDGLSLDGDIAKKILPATPRACLEIFDFYNIDFTNKTVVIFGRSNLVGKPIADYFINKKIKTFIINSQTENPKEISKNANILISAIGKPKYIDKSFIDANKKPVIIDVGINRILEDSKSKIVGDVDFDSVKDFVSAITPVPKGVGPITVACLFLNLLDLIEDR